MGLRICLISHAYPPETIGGGIGTYTATIARGLARAGHEVSVIARGVRGKATSREDGVDVHRILPFHVPGLAQVLRRFGDGKTFADAYLFARAVSSKVREVIADVGLDVIESPEHGAEGFGLATHGPRISHVVRFHSPLFIVNEAVGKRLTPGGRIVDAMERTTARRAVLTTSPSRALAEIVAARFGISLDRIRMVPNCIDHEIFHPAPLAAPHGLTLLYVGKVAPFKGARVLAEAIPLIVRRVPDVKVLIVGSDHPTTTGTGSSKREMLATLREAGVASRVTVLPTTDRANLVRLYQSADVCVLPSLWENFPYTCLEALACGVPVVASAVGGLQEIIHDGQDGVLVPPGDPARLADAVVNLLERPQWRLEMGRAGRKKILSTYTLDRVVAQTVAVYEEAIARSSPQAVPRRRAARVCAGVRGRAEE